MRWPFAFRKLAARSFWIRRNTIELPPSEKLTQGPPRLAPPYPVYRVTFEEAMRNAYPDLAERADEYDRAIAINAVTLGTETAIPSQQAQRITERRGEPVDPASPASREAGAEAIAMAPSIGRIVHYTNLGDRDGKYPPEVQAAIITGVNEDGTVHLHIFYKTGRFDLPACQFTEAKAGSEEARGKWSWPERM